MHSTIHLAMVALDADLNGSMVVTNNADEVLLCFILSKYQRRARTGHQTLSSDTDEKEERDGRKISTIGEFCD